MSKHFFRALLAFMFLTFLLGGYLALHTRTSFEWREAPLFQLSERQKHTLKNLKEPVTLYAYLQGNPKIQRALQEMLNPLNNHLPQLQLSVINPDTHPLEAKAHGITQAGQLYLSVGDKGQRLEIISADEILSAIFSLIQTQDVRFVHAQGSGERAFSADSFGSWRDFYQKIGGKTFQITPQDINQHPEFAQNIDLLLIADPTPSAKLDQAIKHYVAAGGNLIYTTDTLHPYLPPYLQEISGLSLVDGVIVDKAGQNLGFSDPRVVPASMNTHADLLKGLDQLPIFAGSVAFKAEKTSTFVRTPLLQSSDLSWAETGDVAGHIEHNEDEARGPLNMAFELTRKLGDKTQRIIILGDSDVFSASVMNVGGNPAFLDTLINAFSKQSLSHELNRTPLADQFITLSTSLQMLWGAVMLFVLPLAFFLWGRLMKIRFRKRYQITQ